MFARSRGHMQNQRTVLHLKLGLPGIWMTLAVRVLLFVPIALTWLGMGYGCAVLLAHPRFGKLSSKDVQGRTPLERALAELRSRPGCSLNCPQASTARLLAVLQHGPTALEALRESAEEPPALDEEKEERSDAAALAEARQQAKRGSPLSALAEPTPSRGPEQLADHRTPESLALAQSDLHGTLRQPSPKMPEIRAAEPGSLEFRPPHRSREEGNVPGQKSLRPSSSDWEVPWSREAPAFQGRRELLPPERRGEEDSRSSFPSASERLQMEAPSRNQASVESLGLSPQRHPQQLQEEQVRLPTPAPRRKLMSEDASSTDPTSAFEGIPTEAPTIPGMTGPGPLSKLPKPLPVQRSPPLPPSLEQPSEAAPRDPLPLPLPTPLSVLPQEPEKGSSSAQHAALNVPPASRDTGVETHLPEFAEESEPSMAAAGHASLEIPKLPQILPREAEKEEGVSKTQDAPMATARSDLPSEDFPSGPSTVPGDTKGGTTAGSETLDAQRLQGGAVSSVQSRTLGMDIPVLEEVPCVPDDAGRQGSMAEVVGTSAKLVDDVPGAKGLQMPAHPKMTSPEDSTKLSQTDIPTPLGLPPATATAFASSSGPDATVHRHPAEPMRALSPEQKPQASHPGEPTPSQTSIPEAAGPPITTDVVHASMEGLGPKPSSVQEKSAARPATAGDEAIPRSSADAAAMVRTEAASTAVAPPAAVLDESTQELLRQLRQQQAVLQRQVERLTRERDRERSPRVCAVAVAEERTEPGLPASSPKRSRPPQVALPPSSASRVLQRRTPLHVAAKSGRLEVCLALLDEGLVDVNAQDMHGFTCFHYACTGGHFQICAALLAHPPFEALATPEALGCNALHCAAAAGHGEICQLILSHATEVAMHGTFHMLVQQTNIWGQVPFDVSTGSARYVFLTKGLGRGLFKEAGYPRKVHRSVAEVELLSNLAVLLAPQEPVGALFRDFCIEPSKNWASSRLSPDLSVPGVLKKRNAVLFLEYDGYYRHQLPSGILADERKNAALMHYASAGSRIVRVAHSGRNVSGDDDRVIEVVVSTWQPGNQRSLWRTVCQVAQCMSSRLGASLCPATRARLLALPYLSDCGSLEPANLFFEEASFTNATGRKERRDEVLMFLQDDIGLADPLAEAVLRKFPQLLGCSIEANLKPTVQWLHEVGLSEAHVSKAIARFPQLLGLSIEANLKPTVEWLHEVGLSKAQVTKTIATYPSLLGLSIEGNLKPTAEWLHDVGLSKDQVSKAIATFPPLLGCSIEANLKPTVEWLHEVGLSKDQVSKAIATFPALLGYSIEANLKPTVEWLHEVALSKAQVSKAIAAHPQLLGLSIEENLKPTVEWLHEVGLSKAQASKAIASKPQLLGYSIEANLKPTVEWLHEVGLSNAQVTKTIATYPSLLGLSIEGNLKPTVEWLHEVGLSKAQVSKAIATHPPLLGLSIEANLKPTVEWLHEVGLSEAQMSKAIAKFPPLLWLSIEANLKPTVEWLHEVGLTEAQVPKAIAKYPRLLGCSIEANLKPTVQWLHEVGLSEAQASGVLATHPQVLGYSIEKNLSPKLSLLQHYYTTDSIRDMIAAFPTLLSYAHSRLEDRLAILHSCGQLSKFLCTVALTQVRFEQRICIIGYLSLFVLGVREYTVPIRAKEERQNQKRQEASLSSLAHSGPRGGRCPQQQEARHTPGALSHARDLSGSRLEEVPGKDLQPCLDQGKKAHEEIQKKHGPDSAAKIEGHCTFVWDWVREEMPLENDEGTALEESVREIVANSCCQALQGVVLCLLGSLTPDHAVAGTVSWWKAGYPRRVHRSVAEVELLSHLAVLLAPDQPIAELFRDFRVEPSENWLSSRLSPDLAVPGVLKNRNAVLFLEYDGYYRHQLPSGIEADERKNAALMHYAPAGSRIVRVAHAVRNVSGSDDRVSEVVVSTWQPGNQRSLWRSVCQLAQHVSRKSIGLFLPASRARILEFLHQAGRVDLETAQSFAQEAVLSGGGGTRESRKTEVLAFLQEDIALPEAVAEAALRKFPPLLGYSIEANLKFTVEWLHEVGLSKAQVSKAIATCPQLLGYSIEANLKPTVEWLHEVGLSKAQVSKAIATFPRLLGLSIEANLKPTVEWLHEVGLSKSQLRKVVASYPRLLGLSIEANLKPTVEWLHEVGLSKTEVSNMIASFSQLLGLSIDTNLSPKLFLLHGYFSPAVSRDIIVAFPRLFSYSRGRLQDRLAILHNHQLVSKLLAVITLTNARFARPAPKVEITPVETEDVLVFADQAGLCQKLLEKAPEGRVGTKKVITKPPRLLTQEDCETLLSKGKYDLLVVGSPLDPPKSSSTADVIAQQSAVDKFLFLLLQSMMKHEGCVQRLAVLTHDTFTVEEASHKQRGLSIVSGATIFGMMNTARQELGIPIQVIDVEYLDRPDMIPPLSSELFRLGTFGVNTVRQCWPYPIYRGIRHDRPHGRFVYRQFLSREYEAKASKPWDVPSEGIIAISGGNGALGLVMGSWLLERAEKQMKASGGKYKPGFSIQFMSRSAKISDLNIPLWNKVQSKADALGVSVVQGKMDMGSQAAVDKFVQEVSPNLTGFIHSAGVLQDSMLPNQTWEKFEAVYDSKHRAALFLHDALERFSNPNLRFFWVFSSTSAYGNMGQVNYSASNACLDGLARHRVAMGKPCTAIHWGAWGEVGMAATMDDVMRNRVMMGPMPYFTVAQGLQGLEGGLRTGMPEFSVFIVNTPVMYGMMMPDQHVTARYARNSSNEWLPMPAPSAFDREFAYDIYRMYRYIFSPYVDLENNECVMWKKFIEPDPPRKMLADEPEEQVIEVEFLPC
ncbi:6-methylsalicylic acid synthase [Symbiodinium microadriaticum]|uniref:6-methylsalicylic acid synthase n=1 Tax=Symbiodinium microadriaticum TaxID=2951 RepID=A0A1Q9E5F3_SYMMI|nr:6-methylsalicylic acid synthase [Symbiodinium microadriaticum]